MLDKIKKFLNLTPKENAIPTPGESQINISLGIKDNKIIMNLGKPIAMVTMDKSQATAFMEAFLRTQTLLK